MILALHGRQKLPVSPDGHPSQLVLPFVSSPPLLMFDHKPSLPIVQNRAMPIGKAARFKLLGKTTIYTWQDLSRIVQDLAR